MIDKQISIKFNRSYQDEEIKNKSLSTFVRFQSKTQFYIITIYVFFLSQQRD